MKGCFRFISKLVASFAALTAFGCNQRGVMDRDASFYEQGDAVVSVVTGDDKVKRDSDGALYLSPKGSSGELKDALGRSITAEELSRFFAAPNARTSPRLCVVLSGTSRIDLMTAIIRYVDTSAKNAGMKSKEYLLEFIVTSPSSVDKEVAEPPPVVP